MRSATDCIVGVDIDAVEEASLRRIVDRLVEVAITGGGDVRRSPSGKGWRVLGKGRPIRFGKGAGQYKFIEVYGRGTGGLHFLSITSDESVEQYTEQLANIQKFLDELGPYFEREEPPTSERPSHGLAESPPLEDDEVIDKARQSKRSREFSALYDDGHSGDKNSDDLKLCGMLAFYTQDPEQIDRLFRGSKCCREKWDRADYREATIRKAMDDLRNTWQPGEAVTRYGTTEAEAKRRVIESDEGQDFQIDRTGRRPKVMQFNSQIWVEDRHAAALRKVVATLARTLWKVEIADETDGRRRENLIKLAKRLETRRGLDDVTQLTIYGLESFNPTESNRFDDRFPVANGVLMLQAFKAAFKPLWEFDRWSQWTQQSRVIFTPDASCPRFLAFLEEFCCGDKELMRFLQVWFGYCLSGYTTEHKMAVFFGYGRNGKSVLLEVIKFILGDFAATTPADTLLQRRNDQSNDVAALKDKRFVVASESDDGQALAEGRVKTLTGGDTVVSRRLFEEFESYTPKFKLNLATNHKPYVSGSDLGIWRRLLLIPCEAQIDNPDPKLTETLKKEASGILNWMLEGYRIWEVEGLKIPERVQQATNDYRQDSDLIGRFLEDVCTPWRGATTQSSRVYEAYVAWSVEQGHKAFSQMRFSLKMAEKGYPAERRRDGRHFPSTLCGRGRM